MEILLEKMETTILISNSFQMQLIKGKSEELVRLKILKV